MCAVAALFDDDTLHSGSIACALKASGQTDSNLLDALNIRAEGGQQLTQSHPKISDLIAQLHHYKGITVRIERIGHAATPLSHTELLEEMNAHAPGTKFAVWGCEDVLGEGAHWNNAIRTPEGVEFRDYQYSGLDGVEYAQDHKFIAPYDFAKGIDSTAKYHQFLAIAVIPDGPPA